MEAFHPLVQAELVRLAIDPGRADDLDGVGNVEVAVEPAEGGLSGGAKTDVANMY